MSRLRRLRRTRSERLVAQAVSREQALCRRSLSTGKPLDAQVAHVWDLRGGKVTRFQQYTDTWQVAQVTGATPKQ